MPHPFVPSLTDFGRKVNRESVRVRFSRRLLGNSVFWTQQDSCTYKPITVTTPCTGPIQAQVKPNPSTEIGNRHGILPLAEELLATISYQDRERQFSLTVCPLVR